MNMVILYGILVCIIGAWCVKGDEYDPDIVARMKALETKVERQTTALDLQNLLIKTLQDKVVSQQQDIGELKDTVVSQQQDIAELKDTVVSKQQDIGELKDTVVSQQQDITELKDTVVSQQQDIGELKDTVVSQQQDIAELKDTVVSQQQDIAELKDTVVSQKQDKDKATKRLALKEAKDVKKRFVLDTLETVAFEATISGAKFVEHKHIHDKIVFESVSLNVGNSYHPENGTFVAPIGGIYIFSTSVMMHGANTQDLYMHIILEKNGVEIAGAFAYNQGAYEHSSVTAAMDLQVGDSVFVSVERHDDITFYGDKLTNFMGFLLYPL